jgi:hypothetical protein
LIAEGLEKLREYWEAGAKPIPMDNVGLGERSYVLGGNVVQLPKPLRRRLAGSLADLMAAVKRETGTESIDPFASPEIWISGCGVRALIDGTDSREWIDFRLSYSQAWAKLRAWANGPTMLEQKQFVRELVHTFDCDSALVAPWRKLDFLNQIKTSGEVSHGRDRLGRQINSEAAGIEPLPETIVISVPVFAERGERDEYTVVCRVEIDASANRVGLMPKAIELAAIEESHLEAIANQLREGLGESVPVYLGQVA